MGMRAQQAHGTAYNELDDSGAQQFSGESFRLDIGALTLMGPRPLVQDRTCISGRTTFCGCVTLHVSHFGRLAYYVFRHHNTLFVQLVRIM